MDPVTDFSLVLGGPLYQLWRRTRLVRPPLTLLMRRILVIPLLAWLPLLPLAFFSERSQSGVEVSFLTDYALHVRFLLALPMLIAAEPFVHKRISIILRQFLDREVVLPEERPHFEEILQSTVRLRNSTVFEIILLLVVFVAGHWVWKYYSPHVVTWYQGSAGEKSSLNWAGRWYVYVSIPIFQFILLRWYFRIGLWYRFLWKVSRLKLRLIGIHPDRAGGIGFIGASPFAFAPVLVAHSVLVAGLIANYIAHEGAKFSDFKIEILGSVLILLAVALIPLLFFFYQLRNARWLDLRKYGAFAIRYTRDFDRKWVHETASGGKEALGASDIQSLADLANSYQVVAEMRLIPISREGLLQLCLMLLIPYAPLMLTMIPLNQVIDRLLGVVL